MRSFAILSLAIAAAAQTGTGTGTVGTIGYPTATGTASASAVPPVYTTYPAAGNTHKASGAALAVVGAVAAYLL